MLSWRFADIITEALVADEQYPPLSYDDPGCAVWNDDVINESPIGMGMPDLVAAPAAYLRLPESAYVPV